MTLVLQPLDDAAYFDLMEPELEGLAAFDAAELARSAGERAQKFMEPSKWAWLAEMPTPSGREEFRAYMQRYIDQLAETREHVGADVTFAPDHPATIYGDRIKATLDNHELEERQKFLEERQQLVTAMDMAREQMDQQWREPVAAQQRTIEGRNWAWRQYALGGNAVGQGGLGNLGQAAPLTPSERLARGRALGQDLAGLQGVIKQDMRRLKK